MQRFLNRLWDEDDGFMLTTETVLYGTVGVIGVTAGMTALRDSVNSELNDVGKAIGSIDQSFWFSPVVGHSAWTAGSAYYDRADYCDGPQVAYEPIAVHAPACDRPVVCADVFGRPGHHPAHAVPHAAPLPGPDSLPGRGAAVVPPHEAYAAQPHAVRAIMPPPPGLVGPPSKGVVIGEPGPAYVVGSPALVPAPNPLWGEVPPVNVMVNPWAGGPYMVDVPEGYFNRPTVYGPPPNYRVFVHGQHGPRDFGYNYAPAHPPVVRDRPASWDTIDIGFTKVGDDELKQVEKFVTAKCLHVLGSNVTDKGLAYICELPQLESLHLVGTQVTDAGIKQVTSLKKLRFLHLVGTKITDKGILHLAGMKHLEELDVRGTDVTDAGLAQLTKALPTLRIVR